MTWFSFKPDTRPLASRVCFVYEGMRRRGTIPDTDEWADNLDSALKDAKAKDDPEGFCWSVLLAMHLGGLDIALEHRQELAAPAQAWSDTVNWDNRITERHR